jgi:hypothetical protein
VNKKARFLDALTQTTCNYQVTRNDLAWNEYIKKGGNYIEFNEFKSTKKLGPKQWPSTTASTSASPDQAQAVIPRTTTTLTVRAQAEERRQHRIAIYRQAVELAKTSVDAAMDLMEREMIEKFVEHNTWCEMQRGFFCLTLFILLGFYQRSTMFVCVYNVMQIVVVTSTRNSCGLTHFLTVLLNYVRIFFYRSVLLDSSIHSLTFARGDNRSMDTKSLFSSETCQMLDSHRPHRHGQDSLCLIVTGSP